MTPPTPDEMLERMREETERLQPRVEELMAADPQMKPWTAMVIAQDEASLVRAKERIANGADPYHEVNLVGSYARFGAAVELLPPKTLYRHIVDLWRGADPDDSDPRFLAVWKAAHKARVGTGASGKYISTYLRDGKAIPGNARTISIFRGQDRGAPSGIAWSLDQNIAERFATGAATRQGDREGSLLAGMVHRRKVLAYITERGESEVVIDPADLLGWFEMAHWTRVPKEGAPA